MDAANAVQPDVSCRLSLMHMVENLKEVKATIAATKARHRPTNVPVQEMVDIIREHAAEHHSVQSIQASLYTVSAQQAYNVTEKRRPCRFWNTARGQRLLQGQ